MNKRAVPFFALLLCGCVTATAQQHPVENVVFEGAGMRGLAYSGAVAALEQDGLLPQVKRCSGTSAGAITALLLSLHYNAGAITQIIRHTNFKRFNDGAYFFIGGAHRLHRYFGWYRDARLQRWLKKLIATQTGNADLTFLQAKQQGFKDLYVTGTSLTQQKAGVFSYETFPHMKLRDAVRISMGIPLYFEAVFMNDAGEIFQHPKDKTGLQVLVDGGFVANFPITLFDSTKYMDTAVANTFAINNATIGFRIDSEAQLQNDRTQSGLAARPIANLKEYLTAFYVFVLEQLNRQTLTPNDWRRTVSISDGGVSPRIRKLSAATVARLVENGRAATHAFLQK